MTALDLHPMPIDRLASADRPRQTKGLPSAKREALSRHPKSAYTGEPLCKFWSL